MLEPYWIGNREGDLDGLTGTEHLLDELAVEEASVLVGDSCGLFPLRLSKLVSHRGQRSVELISVDLTSVAGVEHGEGSGNGGLIVRLLFFQKRKG